MNLLTTEILKEYAYHKDAHTGEIVERNGVNSYRVAPGKYYNSGVYQKVAAPYFLPNTSYIFDIWMDVDDVVYNGNNVPAGIVIHYSDGTSTNCTATGNSSNPKGFQHVVVKTNPAKTIDGYYFYYYVSIPVYYRLDSYIVKQSNLSIKNTIKSSLFVESTNASVCGGTFKAIGINEV